MIGGLWVYRDPRKHQALAQGIGPSAHTHTLAGRELPGALSIPAQAGLVLVMRGRVTGAKHRLWDARGSYWYHPKMGSKKRTPLTDNRRQRKGIRPKNCPLPKPCRFFPNSGKYPNLHLSSSLLGGQAGPARGSTGLPNHSGLRSPRTQLCVQRSTCNCMRSPGDPLDPGEAAADPHCYPLHPGTSWEGCEPKKSCRGAQLPFPASPACPDGVVSLDLASLYRAQPFPALGQPEEA